MTSLADRAQPRLLAAPSRCGLSLTITAAGPIDRPAAVRSLGAAIDPAATVLGLGPQLAPPALGLAPLPAVGGPGVVFPSTQGAAWLLLTGDDPGVLLHRARAVLAALGPPFRASETVATFLHAGGRDLSGFVDGTANPAGDDAVAAALVAEGAGAGGSFALVQRWVHDLDALDRATTAHKESAIGRTLSDDTEIATAPESAHVKRTAQEDVGFLVRRSMPWGSADAAGLLFVAYAADPEVAVRHLRRMAGADDGVVDGLLGLSRPVSGGLYWCPPTSP